MELVSDRMRRNHHAQSGLHVKATISSGLGPEASTSTSHFFDPCRFHRLRRSLLFRLVTSSSRSLSGHRAVGSRRAADGNWNEASKSIELCILRKLQTENEDTVTCPRRIQTYHLGRTWVNLQKYTITPGHQLNYLDFLGRFPARPTESPFFARIPSVFTRWPRSWSKELAFFCFRFFALGFCGLASGMPIFVGLMVFLALRMEAPIARWSVSSSSFAILRRFARLVRPANLSRLGCRKETSTMAQMEGRKPWHTLLPSWGSCLFSDVLEDMPDSYCFLLTAV
jgi:hypothetical protein